MGYGDHWERAQDAARKADRDRSAPTTGDARALRPERRREHARDLRSRPARRRRSNAAKVDVGRDALRSGAEARREHPRPLAAAAARSGPHQRLPEDRLDRLRRRALPRGHDADAGVGRRRRTRRTSSVPSVHVRARVVLRPGAHHRHGRRREQGRRSRRRTCRSRSKSTATRSRRSTVTRRAERVGVGDVHAVHAGRSRTCAASCAPAPTRCRPTTRSTSC